MLYIVPAKSRTLIRLYTDPTDPASRPSTKNCRTTLTLCCRIRCHKPRSLAVPGLPIDVWFEFGDERGQRWICGENESVMLDGGAVADDDCPGIDVVHISTVFCLVLSVKRWSVELEGME